MRKYIFMATVALIATAMTGFATGRSADSGPPGTAKHSSITTFEAPVYELSATQVAVAELTPARPTWITLYVLKAEQPVTLLSNATYRVKEDPGRPLQHDKSFISYDVVDGILPYRDRIEYYRRYVPRLTKGYRSIQVPPNSYFVQQRE